jgi:hypothetical protein
MLLLMKCLHVLILFAIIIISINLGSDDRIIEDTGYIKFSNGTLICYGTVTSNTAFSFPYSFKDTNYAVCAIPIADTVWFVAAKRISSSQCNIWTWTGNSATTVIAQTVSYIAIGLWK